MDKDMHNFPREVLLDVTEKLEKKLTVSVKKLSNSEVRCLTQIIIGVNEATDRLLGSLAPLPEYIKLWVSIDDDEVPVYLDTYEMRMYYGPKLSESIHLNYSVLWKKFRKDNFDEECFSLRNYIIPHATLHVCDSPYDDGLWNVEFSMDSSTSIHAIPDPKNHSKEKFFIKRGKKELCIVPVSVIERFGDDDPREAKKIVATTLNVKNPYIWSTTTPTNVEIDNNPIKFQFTES